MREMIITFAAIGLAAGFTACGEDGASAPSAETVLESVTPAAGATGVELSAPIAVRFSGPIASGMEEYVDLHQGGIGGPIVPMTCTPSADRLQMTCTPDQPLRTRTTYTIHMGAGMMDGSGRPIETEAHGLAMGGQPVTGQMMGGMHGGRSTGMMGPGWGHPADGHLGMAFAFQTRSD